MTSSSPEAAALPPLTPTLEDYLETIYRLVQEKTYARVRDIVDLRGVKAGSVTPAIKRLADLGMVQYVRREYIGLTPEGERAARRVFARHQLLRRFFGEVLGLSPEEAEENACAMEHSLTNHAMDRLAQFFEFLGACRVQGRTLLELFHNCPLVHGDIPECKDGPCSMIPAVPLVAEEPAVSLAEANPGGRYQVVQVGGAASGRQRLLDLGLLPGSIIALERREARSGRAWITHQGSTFPLTRAATARIRVRGARPPKGST